MSASLEFERFIGSNPISNGALSHPDGARYVFSAGGNVVIGDLIDPSAQSFLQRHDDRITAIAVSHNGKYIASGQCGRNSNVHTWSTETKEVVYTFEEHDNNILGVAFSHDDKILATIGGDHKLLLWDLSNGCIIAANTKLSEGTSCVLFGGFVKDIKRRNTDDYQLATAGKDGIYLWKLDPYNGDLEGVKLTGDARATVTRYISAISFSNDYEYIYGATTSGDYVIAAVKQQKILQAVQATKKGLDSILASDKAVIVGCGDSTIKIFDLNSQFIGQVQFDSPVLGMSFSADDLEILVSTASGTIARMNIATMKYMIISESHTNAIIDVAFPPDDCDRFATASLDGTIRVWDTNEYAIVATATARREQERGVVPQCLVFADCILSGWSDGTVLAHTAETGESLWFIENAHIGGVTALCLSHNKRFILTGGPEGDVRLWELRSRELISHLKEHVNRVTALSLFDDDTIAVSASRDRCILQWDLRSERRTHCHMQRMGGINSIVISKDESHILSVGQERKVVYWNKQADQPSYQKYIEAETDEGKSIVRSNSGKYIAVGGTAGVIRLLDYSTGEEVSSVRGHSNTVTKLAFSPDDKQLVSVGHDGCIFIWCIFTN